MSPPNITLICIVCKTSLKRLHGPTHPEDAVCFSGGAPYGSRHDQDHQIVGLDFYEIFVCDDCWPEVRRTAAVGVKKNQPTPVPNLHFSGKQVDAAFTRAEADRNHVDISEMYDGES